MPDNDVCCGASGTTEIEVSLVNGAHGPRNVQNVVVVDVAVST